MIKLTIPLALIIWALWIIMTIPFQSLAASPQTCTPGQTYWDTNLNLVYICRPVAKWVLIDDCNGSKRYKGDDTIMFIIHHLN